MTTSTEVPPGFSDLLKDGASLQEQTNRNVWGMTPATRRESFSKLGVCREPEWLLWAARGPSIPAVTWTRSLQVCKELQEDADGYFPNLKKTKPEEILTVDFSQM